PSNLIEMYTLHTSVNWVDTDESGPDDWLLGCSSFRPRSTISLMNHQCYITGVTLLDIFTECGCYLYHKLYRLLLRLLEIKQDSSSRWTRESLIRRKTIALMLCPQRR